MSYDIFPTLHIKCIEQFFRTKEVLNVRGKTSLIDNSNNQCSNFRYSLLCEGLLFKDLIGNSLESFEYNYSIGKIVIISGTDKNSQYIQYFCIVNEITTNGYGDTIIDIVSYYNIDLSENKYDRCIYIPNSSLGYCNFLSYLQSKNKLNVDIGHHLILVQIDQKSQYTVTVQSKIDNTIKVEFEDIDDNISISNMYYVISLSMKLYNQNKLDIEFEHLLHYYYKNIKSHSDTNSDYVIDIKKFDTLSNENNNTIIDKIFIKIINENKYECIIPNCNLDNCNDIYITNF